MKSRILTSNSLEGDEEKKNNDCLYKRVVNEWRRKTELKVLRVKVRSPVIQGLAGAVGSALWPEEREGTRSDRR